jgi:hypothetical protein
MRGYGIGCSSYNCSDSFCIGNLMSNVALLKIDNS